MTLRSNPRSAILLYLSTVALLGAACSSEDSSSPPRQTGGASPTGGSSSTGGASSSGGASSGAASGTTVGSFKVTLKAATMNNVAFTEVIGAVYERAYPEDTVWTLAKSEGGCKLLTPSIPFCDPPCTGGPVCVEGGECVPTPSKKSVGTVTVKGVETATGATELALTEVRGSYQPGASVGTLPYPPFEPGDPVSVTASGADLPGFVLNAHGIAPLELTTPEPVPVEPNKSVELEWPPSTTSTSHVEIKLEISHHGGIKGMVTCEGPDSGSFSIPAPLVTDLIALGVAGFPTVSVARIDSDAITISPGQVELLVVSSVAKAVQIPGLISCSEELPCPDDKICTLARKCE